MTDALTPGSPGGATTFKNLTAAGGAGGRSKEK